MAWHFEQTVRDTRQNSSKWISAAAELHVNLGLVILTAMTMKITDF
jgi:hypothetical protein